MKKKRVAAVAAFALFVSALHGQEPVRLTLEECLGYALGQNYSRQSAALNEAAQESALDQAQSERWPNLTASLGENWSHTQEGGGNWNGNYGVSSGVTLYQGGQINRTIEQNKLMLEQTRLQTQRFDNELTIQVLQSFLAVIGSEELLKYQETVLEASERQAAEGRIKLAAGTIIESDCLLLEAQYATDLDNVTSTRIARENNLAALKNLMAMPLTLPVELVYPADTAESAMDMPPLDVVLERGMETIPEIRISDYNVDIAQTALSISKSAYSPVISASAGIGTGHSPDFTDYGGQLRSRFGPSAGVSVSIPIFNNARTKSNVARSRIALQQAELDRKQSTNDIRQILISEYNNVVASGSRFRASDTSRNAHDSSFAAYTEMFHAGAITAVELLQQQNNYINAINNYVQSKYTFILQRKVLDVYIGEPVIM